MSAPASVDARSLDVLLLELQRTHTRIDALIAQQQALVDRIAVLEARVPHRSVLARDVPGHHDY